MLGKTEGRRQRMIWLDGITDSNGYEFEQAPGVGDGQGSLAVLQSMGLQRVRQEWEAGLN